MAKATCDNTMTRRAVLRGSAAGALVAAGHPLPAMAAGDPDTELLALWNNRSRLLMEEKERCKIALVRQEAAKAAGTLDIAAEDALSQPLFDAINACDDAIMATPASSLAGLLLKLRLAAAWATDGINTKPDLTDAYAKTGTFDDDRSILSCLADAERLIGGAA